MPLLSTSPMLTQDRLDVVRKTRANLFNWRGQFTPDLVEYLLQTYSTTHDVVADPFAGSGTVLLESARKGMMCQGLEINPAAYAMSRFYTLCNLELAQRIEVFSAIEKCLIQALPPLKGLPVFASGPTYREQYKNLTDFTRQIFFSLQNGIERTAVLNMLFISESHKKYDMETSLLTSFHYMKTAAFNLPFVTQPVSVRLCDARTMHLSNIRPTLIITSPPYINVFNYHQNYRALLEAVGWDMLRVAPSEFGSNRKHRGNRFKTVIQYALDMDQALRSFWQSLQDGGRLILVIGRESNVRGVPFYNGQLVKEIADNTRAFELIAEHDRKFSNRFGEVIIEDIFVFQKKATAPQESDVRRIAVNHLSAAFPLTNAEVKQDVLEAILTCQEVCPSSMFNVKEAAARV